MPQVRTNFSIIERTWGTVIALQEAAYCCRASSLSRGIPKSPLAGGRVITSCNLSGNGSTWLNKVWAGAFRELHDRLDLCSLQSSNESIFRMQNVDLDL